MPSPVNAPRKAPPLGGFNLTALSLDMRRVLRNRRTTMFIFVFPSLFFYIFGLAGGASRRGGPGLLAYVMVSMAVYGAMIGTTSGAAAVAVERSLGWSRQLRLTPLSPPAYIAMKVLVAMSLGLFAVLSTFAVGAVIGHVRMEPAQWVLCGLAAWGSSCVFAAFGLFMGFVAPSENVMQFVGPAMAIMALFGGIFMPITQFPPAVQTIAKFTPMYGVGELARAPLLHNFHVEALLSVIVWVALFGTLAALLFRRDTQRV